jgi:Tfp pilus assembly protein PilF
MRYRAAGRPPLAQIARELDVDAVLEGTLVRVDERVRLNVMLVHVATRRQIWGGSYDRSIRDVLALQSDIARAVASQVDRRIVPPQRRYAARVRPDAYELYVQGRFHARELTPASLARAVASLEQAIGRDPDFAPAHAALASALIEQGIFGGESIHRIAEVRQAMVKALALDPDLAEAHTIAGMVRGWYDWDWSGAEASFRRALELEPGLVSAHLEYSVLLQTLGRFDEAVASAARAVLLDPASPLAIAGEGRAMYRARRYADAEARYQRALAIDPESGVALDRLAQLYLVQHRVDNARQTLARLERLPSYRPLTALHARLAAIGHDGASARRLLARLPEATGPQAVAAIHVELGEHDRALAVLDRGISARTFVPVALSNPELDPIRTRPQFARLVKNMGLPVDRIVALGRGPAVAARPGCAP